MLYNPPVQYIPVVLNDGTTLTQVPIANGYIVITLNDGSTVNSPVL